MLQIEKLAGKEGDKINFEEVLLAGDDEGEVKVGKPLVSGAKVAASILSQGRADKIIVIKYKRKIRYRRKLGHRQDYTEVKIEKVQA